MMSFSEIVRLRNFDKKKRESLINQAKRMMDEIYILINKFFGLFLLILVNHIFAIFIVRIMLNFIFSIKYISH